MELTRKQAFSFGFMLKIVCKLNLLDLGHVYIQNIFHSHRIILLFCYWTPPFNVVVVHVPPRWSCFGAIVGRWGVPKSRKSFRRDGRKQFDEKALCRLCTVPNSAPLPNLSPNRDED